MRVANKLLEVEGWEVSDENAVKTCRRVVVVFGHSEYDAGASLNPSRVSDFLGVAKVGGWVVSVSDQTFLMTNQYAAVVEHPDLPATAEGALMKVWPLSRWREWVCCRTDEAQVSAAFVRMKCVSNHGQGQGALTVGKVYWVKLHPTDPTIAAVRKTDDGRYEGGYGWHAVRFVPVKDEAASANTPAAVRAGPRYYDPSAVGKRWKQVAFLPGECSYHPDNLKQLHVSAVKHLADTEGGGVVVTFESLRWSCVGDDGMVDRLTAVEWEAYLKDLQGEKELPQGDDWELLATPQCPVPWVEAVCREGGGGLTEGKTYMVRKTSAPGMVRVFDNNALNDYRADRFTLRG